MKIYWQKENELTIITLDIDKLKTTIHYETDGVAMKKDEVFKFKSVDKQMSEYRTTVLNLSTKGYTLIETPEEALSKEEKEYIKIEKKDKKEAEKRKKIKEEERKKAKIKKLMPTRYFRRTNESMLMRIDTEKCEIKVVYGTEESIGNKNTESNKEEIKFNSAEEQTLALNKMIEDLLDNGYVETKPQNKYPTSIKDFYDEPVIKTAIKDFERNEANTSNKDTEHFSLIAWDDCGEDSLDKMLEYFIENKNKYQNLEHFTFGNMDFEVCEMSWINQSNYADFFKSFPNIKSFSVQGSSGLNLGKMDLPKLEILELWGSGLTKETLNDIAESNLPNLKKLNILLGSDEYGCDITVSDIKEFLANTNFTNLVNLGICNIDADTFGDILEAIIESKYRSQIKVLDISKSVSRNKDGQYLLENISKLPNIKYIDLHYNFFTKGMLTKLENCPIEINLSTNEGIDFDDDDDDLCGNPMYTE